MMAYKWGFSGEYVHFGKIVGFVFLSAGVIRLARFNVMKEADAIPSNIFTGLPIPAGALSIASVILVFREPIKTEIGVYMFSAFVIIISFLMISNVKFRTMKIVQSKNGLQILFFIAAILAFMIIYPSRSVPILVVLYLLSPIYFSIMRKLKSSGKNHGKNPTIKGNNPLALGQ
jgi:CDP-diacylglycerol--serine O-phosphatidyltransferase